MLTDTEIDDRFIAWSQWVRRRVGPAGYRSQTLEYGMMRYGVQVLHTGDGLRPEPEHKEEEQVEECVRSMRPALRDIVIIHYLERLTKEQKVRKSKLRKTEFYERLNQAREYAAGWLNARCVKKPLSPDQLSTSLRTSVIAGA